DGTLIVPLVHRAGRDLRQPAVLVIDGVADQPDLGAENVLLERKAGAESELNAGRSRVERLAVIGEFDAVEEADGDTAAMECILRQVHQSVVSISADRIARAVTGDQRPWHEPATAGALELRHASSREELAAIHPVGRPHQQRLVLRLRRLPPAVFHPTAQSVSGALTISISG